MLLGTHAIRRAFESGWTTNRELDELVIGPNSIDVSLSPHVWRLHAEAEVDPYNPVSITWEQLTIPATGLLLEAGELLLGVVNEWFDCNAVFEGKTYVQMYDGRSTCGRIGLLSHVTAGVGDYGFNCPFVLELACVHKHGIRLYPDMRVGQVLFQEVNQPQLYTGSYSPGRILPALGRSRF